MMRTAKILFGLAALAVLGAGCTTTTITNLTPQRLQRNDAGLYPVEIVFDSNQQSLRHETINPMVQVGAESYPMKRAPVVPKRWETVIPVPASTNLIHYQVRVDFEYNRIPEARPDSKLSPPYSLQITDR
ncbi:MAG: hypothetical protein HZA89_10805 [Verrucomicrobia bacterium]|nr:hypothetical protein [Verrucomicrobiota bacterium]